MFLQKVSSPNPQRIISLVPSITELLFDLDLSKETIAITKFCVHPQKWFQTKERIGGTKKLHLERIKALQPDLIIANKEENTQEEINILSNHFPVYLTDISTYDQAIEMILQIGKITSKMEEALQLTNNIRSGFKSIHQPLQLISTAYFIWRDPYMSIGTGTFINDLMKKIGLKNVFEQYERYPQLSVEDIIAANPSLVILSSEPYPFKEKHIAALQAYLPNAKIILADGEMFSWYGSRMKYMPAYFNYLLRKIDAILS